VRLRISDGSWELERLNFEVRLEEFIGAARNANQAASAGYSTDSRGRDSLAERGDLNSRNPSAFESVSPGKQAIAMRSKPPMNSCGVSSEEGQVAISGVGCANNTGTVRPAD
jgi:hypothetical protein